MKLAKQRRAEISGEMKGVPTDPAEGVEQDAADETPDDSADD
jgi:hypothetical protein